MRDKEVKNIEARTEGEEERSKGCKYESNKFPLNFNAFY
jgi:hypothetical protein